MFIYFLTITFPHNVNVWHWNRFLVLIKRMPRCSAFLSSPHWPHGTRVPARRDVVVVPVLIINFQLWSLIPTKKALREFADLSPAPVKDGSGSEQSCRGWNGERVTLITPPNRNECLARTGDHRGRGGKRQPDSQTGPFWHSARFGRCIRRTRPLPRDKWLGFRNESRRLIIVGRMRWMLMNKFWEADGEDFPSQKMFWHN